MHFLLHSQLAGIILIAVFLIACFLWALIRRADREYLICVCGKLPKLEIDADGWMRYVCECGNKGWSAKNKEGAAEKWQMSQDIDSVINITIMLKNKMDQREKDENNP